MNRFKAISKAIVVYFIGLFVFLLIWFPGCWVADVVFPADLSRCWIMAWGVLVTGIGTLIKKFVDGYIK